MSRAGKIHETRREHHPIWIIPTKPMMCMEEGLGLWKLDKSQTVSLTEMEKF